MKFISVYILFPKITTFLTKNNSKSHKYFVFNNFLLLSVWFLLHKTVNSQRNTTLITKLAT